MNKKRLILLILAAVLAVFTMGCQFQEEAPGLEVDDVAIYFGVSSYAMFGADEETLRYLVRYLPEFRGRAGFRRNGPDFYAHR